MTGTAVLGHVAALAAVVGLAVASLPGCGGDDDGGGPPRIDSLSVGSGKAGDTLEVLGAHFCGASTVGAMGQCEPPVAGIVTFTAGADMVGRGQVTAWRDRTITLRVPAGLPAGPSKLKVTVDAVASNEVDFTLK